MNKKISGLSQIAHLYKNFFFDLDGVLWKGKQSIPGSLQCLEMLRHKNKNLFFITNSSVRSRKQLMKRFDQYGFKVDIDECFPSSYISPLYLREKYPEIKKIMLFGTQYLADQLISHGFEVNRITDLPQTDNPIAIAIQHLDLSYQAVLLGWDCYMNFTKISLIGAHVQNGIKLFATNPDKFTMLQGYKSPGTGSLVSCIESAFEVKAQIIGKPNNFILDYLIKKNSLSREECVMIGDNVETDIAFGKNGGISTVCVLTGVTKLENLLQLEEDQVPQYYCDQL